LLRLSVEQVVSGCVSWLVVESLNHWALSGVSCALTVVVD